MFLCKKHKHFSQLRFEQDTVGARFVRLPLAVLLLLAVVVLFVSEGAEAGPLELERLELKRVNSS